jgi:hypothetical protein
MVGFSTLQPAASLLIPSPPLLITTKGSRSQQPVSWQLS